MTDLTYYILSGVCVALVLLGINLMSKVKLSVKGNALSAISMILAIGIIIVRNSLWPTEGVVAPWGMYALYAVLAIAAVFGIIMAGRIKMIAMPQTIALLNGLGGAASALVAAVTAIEGASGTFEASTAGLALAVGGVTLTGSLIAAGKLARILDARPKSLKGHNLIFGALLVACVVGMVMQTVGGGVWAALTAVAALVAGVVFVMRVGGADMPITISLLNSLSGVAGGIAGMAIGDPLLVVVGGIVGASGLILTQDMCKAMNRTLGAILTGKTTAAPAKAPVKTPAAVAAPVAKSTPVVEEKKAAKLDENGVAAALQTAKKVIIVPGYGMALSQAQGEVAHLTSVLEGRGVEVKFAIHPVAGRMPGHMSVLLCEADIDYEKLFMMEDINDDFASCDLAIVIGANDVTNPAANTAEGTPIYGMPVLSVEKAPMTVFCNFDTKPGYAGVENPLYSASNVLMMLGDAKASVAKLEGFLSASVKSAPTAAPAPVAEAGLTEAKVGQTLQNAKKVIIVPGYGMALSQAQGEVAHLTSVLEGRGVEVKFAIHPVAGRMPGHMSVLLCEADIDYEKLYMMEDINDDFGSCDIAIVIGANDVTNPAANSAEGTPIYGMPILNVEQAPMAVFCNFDTKPGYAGVENPLYSADNVLLMLGDAKASVSKLEALLSAPVQAPTAAPAPVAEAKLSETKVAETMKAAKKVIIVPGYGMALSQAQGEVAHLAAALEKKGAEVKFAIHPVAGRMPGHMSVLLCEADIDYEKLYMMEDINDDFSSCDIAIVIGANDVTNPAANSAEGTPIYGMPILNVEQAPMAVFCNFDTKPGYAGVENPLYSADNVLLLLGDAKESVAKLHSFLK